MIADEMQPKIDTSTAAASSRPAVGPSSAVVASSPILAEAPDVGQWHRPEVDQVHQQIQQTDQRGAADHPEREIPLGAPDLTGRKGRLVPPIEVAEDRHHGEPHGREQVPRRQRRRPIH